MNRDYTYCVGLVRRPTGSVRVCPLRPSCKRYLPWMPLDAAGETHELALWRTEPQYNFETEQCEMYDKK